MMWATLTGLEELMQELDTLGRRSQIADGGWLDVFLYSEEAGGQGRSEEDADKKGYMDGGSGEPLTSAARCPSLQLWGMKQQ